MRNPARDDQHLGSFKFNRRTGAWSDFAEPDRFSGYGLVSLYAAINRITTDQATAQLTGTVEFSGCSTACTSQAGNRSRARDPAGARGGGRLSAASGRSSRTRTPERCLPLP